MVNGPVLANTEVNVLQAVNLTLATSAFLALADCLPRLVDFSARPSVGMTLYVGLIVLWTIKLLVENHKSFAGVRVRTRPGYAVFQLLMAVAMFLALAVAAKNADNFTLSAQWLGASLAAGLVWLIGLGFSFGKTFDFKLFPWIWVFSAVVTIVGAFVFGKLGVSVHSVGGVVTLIMMLAALIVDAIVSRSFRLA